MPMPNAKNTAGLKDVSRGESLFNEIIRRENRPGSADQIIADMAKAEQTPATDAAIRAIAYGAAQSRPNSRLTSVAALGKIIREKRKDMRLTQQQFADITGVGRRFISELESGKPSLEFGRVLKVCHAVGIDLAVVIR